MGILTSTYQVSANILQKFKADPELLDFLVYDGEGEVTPEMLGMSAGWSPPACHFDKEWEDMATILSQLGSPIAGHLLENGGTTLEFSNLDAYVRYWETSKMQEIKQDLQGQTFATLCEKARSHPNLRDWSGYTVQEHELQYYLQSFDAFCRLLDNAIELGDAIFAVST